MTAITKRHSQQGFGYVEYTSDLFHDGSIIVDHRVKVPNNSTADKIIVRTNT